MPLVGGRSGQAIRHRAGSIPSSGARRGLPTNSRHAKWPASPRSPKSVGPESFSVPERVHRAGWLVQPGVQPGSGLVVSLSGRRDSNPRRPAWEAGILPLNYARVREGRGTINRDIQNCLGRIGLNLLRPVKLTFARSISNIDFEGFEGQGESGRRVGGSGPFGLSPFPFAVGPFGRSVLFDRLNPPQATRLQPVVRGGFLP